MTDLSRVKDSIGHVDDFDNKLRVITDEISLKFHYVNEGKGECKDLSDQGFEKFGAESLGDILLALLRTILMTYGIL